MEQGLQAFNASERARLWAERITACRSSGMTVRAWCKENGIAEKTYYYWQRRIYQQFVSTTEAPCFAEVSPAAPLVQTPAAVVYLSDARAEIFSGADAATVQAVIQALRSC